MNEERAHKCPDCQSPMSPINLHDKTDMAGFHGELEYSLPVGAKTFWTGGYPVAGTIAAYMCSHCGRVNLYANPKAK